MAKRGSGKSAKKVANRLMAVSSAAVLAVYAAGYTRTRSAADRLESQFGEGRATIPGSARAGASGPSEIHRASLETATPPAIPAASVTPLAPQKPEKPDQAAKAASVEKAEKTEKVAKAEKIEQIAKVIAPAPAAVTQPPVSTVAPAAPAPAAVVAPVPAPAPAPAPAPDPYKAVVAAAAAPWKDGTYDGWGSCRHGDLQVTVTIAGGKIVSAPVSNCQTRYSCDIIDKLPKEAVYRQSPNVDYVGGATQSTDAYYWALVVALGKAH